MMKAAPAPAPKERLGKPVRWALTAGALAAAGAAVLFQAVRAREMREAEQAWDRLAARAAASPAPPFDLAMVEGLPEPAHRFFRFAIAPGTPLRQGAVITMSGRFGLGDRADHRFHPMEARQILAPPHGLVWIPQIGSGLMRFSGSDGLVEGFAWTRFWLLDAVPLVRLSGGDDIARSAAGRLIGESLWTPAALLPSQGVRWEAAGPDSARARLRVGGDEHGFELTVGQDGRPLSLVLQRWSNANPDKVYRWQPFGATYQAWGRIGGFTVPTRLKGGNHFGTPDFFPFFEAEVSDIRYL